jgi:TolB-like protein/Tfp pilus assembly protein PilF
VTDPSRAVFLSYASQDGDRVQQLCDALRAADIEVWFDQHELRGGDAWDAMIRRQIKGCFLFVPIISAETQAREEGYFRREWNLAVARTLDMAEGRAFILPVVIDGTPDAQALVPEKFREVQWTRLPDGANYAAFVEHVRRLVAPGANALRADTSSPTAQPAAARSVPPAAIPTRPPTARSWLPWIAVAVLALGLAYALASRFLVPRREASAAEAAGAKSVAVLPFVDMSEKRDQEYFSDGLAEELIEQLGRTPGLKVIARTSSFSFKGKADDIATIAAKLKVANVLEGSVRRAGSRLRVSTQLIRADTALPVWSDTFDREFKDVFAIQDEIASAVVSALKVKLAGPPAGAVGHGTTNPEAYNAYLLGRQLHNLGTSAGVREAVTAFQKAIGLDPRYADAYASLALSQQILGDMTGDLTLKKQGDEAADKAIALDPRLADGYATRGYLRYSQHHDWTGAESDFRRALDLDPTNTRTLQNYGRLLAYVGREKEAVVMLRKATELDPLSDTNWQNLGVALVFSRQYPAAYEAFRHALAIQPADGFFQHQLARLQLIDGKTQESLVTAEGNSLEPFRLTDVATAEHTRGDDAASRAALEKLMKTDGDDAAYQVAEVYAWRGERDQAFEWLERAIRQKDGGLEELKGDPLLAPLHADPRYAAMLGKLNFPR